MKKNRIYALIFTGKRAINGPSNPYAFITLSLCEVDRHYAKLQMDDPGISSGESPS